MSSRRRKARLQQSSPSLQAAGTSKDPSPPAAKPHRPMSRRRLWLYRLLSATLAPALFLCLLEGGLRLFGYGYPTDFFLPISGRSAWTTNPRFGWQFFPPAIARTPEVCELPFAKDKWSKQAIC